MQTNKGFPKAAKNTRLLCLTFYLKVSSVVIKGWSYISLTTKTQAVISQKCLTCHPLCCRPRHLSESAYGTLLPLIGEPVIFCCWTMDFYLRSYLLMDTKPAAVY